MTVVGMLGPIGSGKSTVARLLEGHGAIRIDADAVAHEVLARPAPAAAVRARWGDAVFAPDGTVDRNRLAERVFGNPAELDALERILHPPVREEMAARLADLSGGIAVLDAPLLYETGMHRLCTVRVYVDAPEGIRRERTVRDRGWSSGELARRERFQAPLEEKRTAAEITLENTGNMEDLRERVGLLWTRLQGLEPPGGGSPSATSRSGREIGWLKG